MSSMFDKAKEAAQKVEAKVDQAVGEVSNVVDRSTAVMGGSRTGTQRPSSARSRAAWGVVLIGIGALFLLAKFDVIEIGRFRHWWPAILVGIGTVWMLAPDRPRQIASGLSMFLIGLWCFACMHHWYGFTFTTTWPVVVVIWGIEMVLAALIESRQIPKEERHV